MFSEQTASLYGASTSTDPLLKALRGFKQVTRKYALFHILLFILGCLELFSFVLVCSFFTKSATLAFSLAGIVLTAFSYLVLLFYLQAKKPHDLLAIHQEFAAAHAQGKGENGEPVLPEALERLVAELHRLEYGYYLLPPVLGVLKPLAEKFSVWCHWKDLHDIKEMLLFHLIQEYIGRVKRSPIDPKVHADLGLAYSGLAKLYQDPREIDPSREHVFVSGEYGSSEMKEKHLKASRAAIEEFKIVSSYLPQNPWVYGELASLYLDIGKPEEAIKSYESFLEISPHDPGTLFKLGVLYFSQGLPAQALTIYHTLQTLAPSQAESLISYYTNPSQ